MHRPVLLKEVLEIFNPQRGETYIDATINGGGHSVAILERIGPEGKLLGIDWDCELIKKLKRGETGFSAGRMLSKNKNLILVCDNYVNIRSCARKYNLVAVDGILFDLGFSSYHLESARRGFSFLKNEPLDMRYHIGRNYGYDYRKEITAAEIINEWPEAAIADILRKYGEERFYHKIASAIVRTRKSKKIATTGELVEIIKQSVSSKYLRQKVHPATRTFQALRIAVNRELENLEKALPEALALLRPRGKLVVISFHSLEDRIVKKFFQERAKMGELIILTKKPTTASHQELDINPRARSAKLRAAEKNYDRLRSN